jgi:hypothetical protein
MAAHLPGTVHNSKQAAIVRSHAGWRPAQALQSIYEHLSFFGLPPTEEQHARVTLLTKLKAKERMGIHNRMLQKRCDCIASCRWPVAVKRIHERLYHHDFVTYIVLVHLHVATPVQ